MSTERTPTQADFSLDGPGGFDVNSFLVDVGFAADTADKALDLINRPESFEAACADCATPEDAEARVAQIMGAIRYKRIGVGEVTMGGGRKVGRPDAKTSCVVRLGNAVYDISAGMSNNYSIACYCRDVRKPTDNERLRLTAALDSRRAIATLTAFGRGAREAYDQISRAETTLAGDETIVSGKEDSRSLFEKLFRRK